MHFLPAATAPCRAYVSVWAADTRISGKAGVPSLEPTELMLERLNTKHYFYSILLCAFWPVFPGC